MKPFSKPISVLALIVMACSLISCVSSHPITTSEDTLELFLTTRDFKILGANRGSTEHFQILGFGFGATNSFAQAERNAYEEKGGDLLIGRTRLKSFEGLMIPGFWLSWFGLDEQDFPLIGTEVFTTSGIAVKMGAWHQNIRSPIKQ